MKAGEPVTSGVSGVVSASGVAAGGAPRPQAAPPSGSSPSVASASVIGRPSCSMRIEAAL